MAVHQLKPIVTRVKADAHGYVNPALLQNVLDPAQTVVITFASEASMRRYRFNLYAINKQGDFRYRTVRDELSMWGLVVWRMK